MSGFTGVLCHSPLLRPRTDSTRLPRRLIPHRVSVATIQLDRRPSRRPTGVVGMTYRVDMTDRVDGLSDIGLSFIL